MRRNASTVVVLAGPAPGEVLAALGRSMNVTLFRPERHGPERPAAQEGDGLAAAAEALQRAGRATSPYALVSADPLAAVAASWREMWDVSRPEGSAAFEQEAVTALAAWRGAGSSCRTTTWCSPARTPAGRISISGRCVRPGRTGSYSCPSSSLASRPPECCTPSARCGTARGGRAWTR